MDKSNNIYPCACNVSGGSLPDGYKITLHLNISFDGVTDAQLLQWAASNRIIAFQRNLRNLSTKALEKMAENTISIHASQCGMKVESKEETIAKFKTAFAGMDDEMKKQTLAELKE